MTTTAVRRFCRRVAAFIRFTRAEDELTREVDAHLALLEDDFRARGLTGEDARIAARRAFGGIELTKEHHRAERSFAWLDDARRDAWYAVRTLRRAPGFSAVVILTLALGVGINAAIFSVVNAVLVRPLPFPASDRLAQLWETSPVGNRRNVVSAGNYLDWREQATSFEAIGAYSVPYPMALSGGGEPIPVQAARMTSPAFAALGVGALVGHVFETPEMAPPAEAADALISRAFWRQRFGGDPAIVGQRVILNDRPYTIVGVMPAGFDFPTAAVDVWIPQTFAARERNQRRSHNWRVVGRLADGVSLASAEQELRAIAARNAREYPEFMEGWSVNAVALHRDMVGDVRSLLVILSALALTLLAGACVNLASLLLARTRRREIEFALRSAVGAGRSRLLRQVVIETLVLGVAGGGLGLVLVALTLPMLLAGVPADIPLIGHVSIDAGVLAVSAGLTIAATLTVALVPALRVTGGRLQPALQSVRPSGDSQAGRMRSALLVAQFAISIALIIAAGLLVRSFSRLADVEYGFDPSDLVEAMVDLPSSRYGDQASQQRFYDELLNRVRALPGIKSAAVASDAPLSGNSQTFSFAIDGKPATNPSGREDPVSLVAVSPGYFETLAVPLIEGRSIQSTDREGAPPIIVINRALADRFWSGTSAVGHRLSFEGPGGPWYEIAGVVGNIRDEGPDKPASPALFLPYGQRQPGWTWMSWGIFIVRAQPGADPASLAGPLRRAVWGIDASLPLLTFDRVDALYAENAARRRFAMQLAAGFAALALLLAMFGVYGVVSYGVGERTQEFGIRIALGAGPRQILAPVMAMGLAPAVLGIGLGAIAAAALTRWLEPLLFNVQPIDLRTFSETTLLLLAVAALAAWMPARRATLIDPARNLRSQ